MAYLGRGQFRFALTNNHNWIMQLQAFWWPDASQSQTYAEHRAFSKLQLLAGWPRPVAKKRQESVR